jgi:hypothetical protein
VAAFQQAVAFATTYASLPEAAKVGDAARADLQALGESPPP